MFWTGDIKLLCCERRRLLDWKLKLGFFCGLVVLGLFCGSRGIFLPFFFFVSMLVAMKDTAIALLICVWINGWVCNVAAEGPAYHSCFLPQFCLNWETCLHNIFCLCSLGSPDSKSDLFFFWQCMMLETNCGRATSNPQFHDVPCGCLSFLKKRYGLQRLQVPASSASF